MGTRQVSIRADEGLFLGLAKQNMLFHQCIFELCDNAIAAAVDGRKPNIDIFLNPVADDPDKVDVWVCDNGRGMDDQQLETALQPGRVPTSNSRLNEHGFGLKNSLATLSGGNGEWTLWTKASGKEPCKVSGPFSSTMEIVSGAFFPSEAFLPSDSSTIIFVRVKLSFLRTVQGRGGPSSNLSSLRMWLIEHLGVTYRGFLEQDPETQDTSARIKVSINSDTKVVPPVPVPFGNVTTKYIDVTLGTSTFRLIYKFGTLDEELRDQLLYKNEKAKYYYQNNQTTQGIDIRLGRRVIATRQFETIWKTSNGKAPLTRHNNYNDFLGELLIPEDIPRGILTTVNNKTDFNLDDPNWNIIFDELNSKYRPPEKIRETTEAGLRDKWKSMLQNTNPDDEITSEQSVWPSSTRIDVYRKSAIDHSIIIYELKAGKGAPIHLYQLKMYWDGLLLQGEQPKEAVLMVEDYDEKLQEMANIMNEMPTPNLNNSPSLPYNFKIEKHRDKGLA